jgi:serine/threonine protein kinase
MSDQPRRPVFFWLVLLVCVVYAGLFAFTIYAVARYYGVEKTPGWSARTDGNGWFVSGVDAEGPAAGRMQLGVIAPARAAEWFRQLLEGLQFAHNMGVVHRDLKPENVMIVEVAGGDDELKIMDFGLAKVVGGGTGITEPLTAAGAVMGTLGYIAPEVFTGGPVDERADIFAIGVMVVETLVGARPFGGQTPHEVLTSLLHSEYHLPGESIEIRSLDAVVQGCLAKDPRDRYGSAIEVASVLVPTLARCADFQSRPGGTIPGTPAL